LLDTLFVSNNSMRVAYLPELVCIEA